MSSRPLEPPCEPLTGDSHAHLLERLVDFARTIGFTVSFEPIPGSASGYCDTRAKRIVVDATAPPNGQVRTLVHGIAHGLGVGYGTYSPEQAEVIVDTVTFACAGSIATRRERRVDPVRRRLGEVGALKAVAEFASLIDSLARRIEDAVRVD